MITLTAHDLNDLATNILETQDATIRARFVQILNRTYVGAEALYLIVRDDIGGAGDVISDALWVGL